MLYLSLFRKSVVHKEVPRICGGLARNKWKLYAFNTGNHMRAYEELRKEMDKRVEGYLETGMMDDVLSVSENMLDITREMLWHCSEIWNYNDADTDVRRLKKDILNLQRKCETSLGTDMDLIKYSKAKPGQTSGIPLKRYRLK